MSETVIVSGGGRGLGLTITRRLLDKNYSVIVVSRTESDDLRALTSDKLAFVSYDFNNVTGIHMLSNKLVKLAEERFDSTIYGLVNNAAAGNDGILGTMHESEIANILTVNIEAPILLTKYISRQMMLKLIRGRIINIGSIIGSTGYSGLSVYAASKAAIEGFTKSLAREVGKRGITANVVAPGFMTTDMTATLAESNLQRIRRRSALGEFATTNSVASMVVHLLGPDGDSITGTVITIDAGSTA